MVHGTEQLKKPEAPAWSQQATVPWRVDTGSHRRQLMAPWRGAATRGLGKGVSSDRHGLSIKPPLNKVQGEKGKRDERRTGMRQFVW